MVAHRCCGRCGISPRPDRLLERTRHSRTTHFSKHAFACPQFEAINIGVAFWPGGTVEDWGSRMPCDPIDRAYLTSKNVGTTMFTPAIDYMAHLRGNRFDEDEVFNLANGTGWNATVEFDASTWNAQSMSIVVYSGNGTDSAIRSPPRLIRNYNATKGPIGRIGSLTVVAKFDKGNLIGLGWNNGKCGDCLGLTDPLCLKDVGEGEPACVTDEISCQCIGTSCPFDIFSASGVVCQSTVTMAYTGTDRHSVALKTGMQLARLAEYSATGAYASASAAASARANSAFASATGVQNGFSQSIGTTFSAGR